MAQAQIATLILLGSFFVLILLKMPISFTLAMSSALTMIYLRIPLLTLVQQMAKSSESFALLAVPFFVFAGEIMGAGGISEKILEFSNALVGRFRGGLAYVNCLSSMFFGGISGSATADISSLGSILLPMMKKQGYDENFSTGLTITTACQGILIPPSHNMVFFAVAAGGVSVGKLFLGGMVPGIMLGLAMMALCFAFSKKYNFPKGTPVTFKEGLKITADAILALLTAVIIIFGVTGGFFTATEASSIACIYALIISLFVYKKLKVKMIPKLLRNVLHTLSLSFSLIATAGAFSWIMAYLQVPRQITQGLLSITSNKVMLLIMINLMMLLLGCIMDMAPLIMILTPILLPVATSLGMDPVHFGVIMVFNLAIGLCTPPVGSALYMGCAVGKVRLEDATKAMMPMYIVMICVLILVNVFPPLVTWLPSLMK